MHPLKMRPGSHGRTPDLLGRRFQSSAREAAGPSGLRKSERRPKAYVPGQHVLIGESTCDQGGWFRAHMTDGREFYPKLVALIEDHALNGPTYSTGAWSLSFQTPPDTVDDYELLHQPLLAFNDMKAF